MRLVLFLLTLTLPLCGAIPITLEFAATPEERAWGLMGRDSLPQNHGMLFIYPNPRRIGLWMFNCKIDLSAAFIDRTGTIQEIVQLDAYPEKMDENRKVHNIRYLKNYPPHDPIIRFFREKGVVSSRPALYVLEMEKGWFKKKGVGPGAKLKFNRREGKGRIEF